MKDVLVWLKSFCLYKYVVFFFQMIYEEMMVFIECQLEVQNVIKGVRYKIVISIQKFKER